MKPKSYKKSFASYEGLTPTGKKKVDCWSSKNKNIRKRDKYDPETFNYEWSGDEWKVVFIFPYY